MDFDKQVQTKISLFYLFLRVFVFSIQFRHNTKNNLNKEFLIALFTTALCKKIQIPVLSKVAPKSGNVRCVRNTSISVTRFSTS